MRSRFEQQFSIGRRLIEETPTNFKRSGKLEELIAAMKAIYCNAEYNQKIFCVLERHLTKNKKRTGRKGMDLWCIFVLSQVRLCLNTSYEWIHDLSNNHLSIRWWLMGVETEYGFKRVEFSYQNIYDNIKGWRKIKNWRAELKGLMRELGKASASGGKGKEDRVKNAASKYISKSRAFYSKVEGGLPSFPITDERDLSLVISLEYFMQLLQKHIDLVDRRIIKGNKQTTR